MSLSDCIHCGGTPCICGYDDAHLRMDELKARITTLKDIYGIRQKYPRANPEKVFRIYTEQVARLAKEEQALEARLAKEKALCVKLAKKHKFRVIGAGRVPHAIPTGHWFALLVDPWGGAAGAIHAPTFAGIKAGLPEVRRRNRRVPDEAIHKLPHGVRVCRRIP